MLQRLARGGDVVPEDPPESDSAQSPRGPERQCDVASQVRGASKVQGRNWSDPEDTRVREESECPRQGCCPGRLLLHVPGSTAPEIYQDMHCDQQRTTGGADLVGNLSQDKGINYCTFIHVI